MIVSIWVMVQLKLVKGVKRKISLKENGSNTFVYAPVVYVTSLSSVIRVLVGFYLYIFYAFINSCLLLKRFKAIKSCLV